MKAIYTYTEFAHAVGHNDRYTQEASQPFHNEYVSMTPEGRKRMFKDWQVNYLTGKFGNKVADRILSQSRDDRTEEHQKAYKRANAQFDYHVKRGYSDKPTTRNSVDPVSKLVKEYNGMTKAEQKRFLTAIAK